jgi:predicted DNA-binding transcriptional regulator
MSKDQSIGALVLVVCVLAVVAYGWLVFLSGWSLLALELTGFIAVGGILAIGAWIGWTMATAPALKPLEDLSTKEPEAKKE